MDPSRINNDFRVYCRDQFKPTYNSIGILNSVRDISFVQEKPTTLEKRRQMIVGLLSNDSWDVIEKAAGGQELSVNQIHKNAYGLTAVI